MANTRQIEVTHYRADPGEPPIGGGNRLLSRLGVWLIMAVIVAAIVSAGVYFSPRPHPTLIKPGQPQQTIPLPHAQHAASGA
ncbi:MAG TPA: hypothetical protein VE309_02020 [Caulobacteraceae bacterium]|nr:hypothetical protein [Caulobacteraceae bacterium]